MPEAPADGNQYVRQDNNWVLLEEQDSQDYEELTVTVTSSGGYGVIGAKIIINGTQYTGNGTDIILNITYGTNYSVVPKDFNALYATGTTTTASQPTRSVVIDYTPYLGVYIYDTDGVCTSAANGDTSNNNKAVGVYVGSSSMRRVISPNVVSGVYTVSGTASITTCSQASSGIYRTTTSALYANCNITFLNGSTGILWSLKEAQFICNNYTAISACIELLGGTNLLSYQYWGTSTCGSSLYVDDDCIDSGGYSFYLLDGECGNISWGGNSCYSSMIISNPQSTGYAHPMIVL